MNPIPRMPLDPGEYKDRDEPVNIPLDPETGLRAIFAVNPDDDPVDDD